MLQMTMRIYSNSYLRLLRCLNFFNCRRLGRGDSVSRPISILIHPAGDPPDRPYQTILTDTDTLPMADDFDSKMQVR